VTAETRPAPGQPAGPAGRGFAGEDVPSLADLQNCIHCGFCLPSCPTYVATGLELESPRGRLHLIQSVVTGRTEATPRLLEHLDLCLQCRACETACPSSVPYGAIMEDARASIVANPETRPRGWRLRTLVLRHVVARPRVLRAALALGRLYSRSGLQRLVRGRLARYLPQRLRRLESLAPALDRAPFRQTGVLAAPSTPAGRVALLLGCVHGELYPQTHEATVRVLERLGFEVVAPPEQVCCGALHSHAGDAVTARALARRNIAGFEKAGVDAVIVNAAGCGAAMKEYDRLLRNDEHWSERAERFAASVRDVLEFVAAQDFARGLGPLEAEVTLQDSCHLAHAQGIREAPRAILRAIPGLQFTEMATPDRCCGSAGIYSAVQPEMSARVLEAKMADVASTGATTIGTANPGCTLQLEAGVRRTGLDAEVRHVIELLDEAMRAGDPDGR
jgi:glycolate oxidase iron-sulfur subunit